MYQTLGQAALDWAKAGTEQPSYKAMTMGSFATDIWNIVTDAAVKEATATAPSDPTKPAPTTPGTVPTGPAATVVSPVSPSGSAISPASNIMNFVLVAGAALVLVIILKKTK